MAIGVFLVDGRELVRRRLRDLVDGEDDLVVVGEAAKVAEALAAGSKANLDLSSLCGSLSGVDHLEKLKPNDPPGQAHQRKDGKRHDRRGQRLPRLRQEVRRRSDQSRQRSLAAQAAARRTKEFDLTSAITDGQASTGATAPGERYSVLIKADTPGIWAFHCHIVSHAENDQGLTGMVTTFIVK